MFFSGRTYIPRSVCSTASPQELFVKIDKCPFHAVSKHLQHFLGFANVYRGFIHVPLPLILKPSPPIKSHSCGLWPKKWLSSLLSPGSPLPSILSVPDPIFQFVMEVDICGAVLSPTWGNSQPLLGVFPPSPMVKGMHESNVWFGILPGGQNNCCA